MSNTEKYKRLHDRFNKTYITAIETSDREMFLKAAMAARKLIYQMEIDGVLCQDSYDNELREVYKLLKKI